jgi:bifunctional DNA-binding transcriptional regulator/antitoxin component of YhaV-PrlF toxin-antitoxin module
VRITKGGQIGLPSEIRRRWGTHTLLLEDLGDHIVLRPALGDPVRQLRGVFAGACPTSDELLGHERSRTGGPAARESIGLLTRPDSSGRLP